MSNLTDLLPAGGGGKNVDFVASGTLANGQAVALKTNGQVEAVSETAVSGAVGTTSQFSGGDIASSAIAYDSTNNKILVAYSDYTASQNGKAVVGTISGTSITFGTPVQFSGPTLGDNNRRIGICFNSTEGKFVIVYRDSSINNNGRAITATISGTSVSFGSSAAFTTDVTNHQACSFDSTSNKVVIVYSNDSDGGDGYGVVATISGTSLSFGTPVEFESGYAYFPVPVYDSNANKTVIVYRDGGNSNYGTAIVATVSSTAISYGSSVVFEAAQTEHQTAAFDSANKKIVIAYADMGNSGYGTSIVGTVSGTSISFGTAAVFHSISTGSVQMQAAYNVKAGKTVIGYGGSNVDGTYVEATVSGTSLSFSSPVTFESVGYINQAPAVAAYDSTNFLVLFSFREAAVGTGDAVAIRSAYTSTNNTDFVGITDAAIANTASGSVTIKGGINKTVTGLTPNATYYVQNDGTLNTATSAVNYDIANGSYTQAFSVSSQDNDPTAIAFNTDGTKMFIAGNQGNDIGEYTLSTGFDVSTASFVDSFSVNSQETSPTGLAFNTDGTRMFVSGTSSNTVHEYALSTGFDVSTASYTDGFSTAAQDSNTQGVTFNTDGTKMFVTGESNKKINEYTLSTGFDVSTASFVDGFLVSSQADQPKEAKFNSDGTEMFVLTRNNTKSVYKYNLSTGFDVSSASYSSVSFSVDNKETNPQGLAFSADGSKMYVCGYEGQDVNQYATTTTVTNSTTVEAGKALSATSINLDYTT